MSSVPCVHSAELVRETGRFLLDAGYTEARMSQLGLTAPPWRGSAVRPLLEFKIPDQPLLGLLIRLFYFGESVPGAEAAAIVPGEALRDMLACGMLIGESDGIAPGCMLTHFGPLLLACDSVRRAREGAAADLVLGVNTPTRFLDHCRVASPGAEVLDLGTGCGTLALACSATASAVLATDINPRALRFTQFNAALNGIGNISTARGDRFEPAANRKFDLILSNPPFFLTPSPRLLYTDNPSDLDSFVEGLARAAPAFLKEGGFFQMLCEWVQVEGEAWTARLGRWLEASGCDALVLKAYESAIPDYVLKRAAEAASLYGEAGGQSLRDHAGYFAAKKVTGIFGGLIGLRRRTAPNWVLFEEVSDVPSGPAGELLRERFATEDLLAAATDSRLLESKPRLSPDVHLVQEAARENGAWKPTRIYLERRSGIVRRLAFDAAIASLVSQFDGTRTLDSLLARLARDAGAQKREAVATGLRLVKKLAALSLVQFEANPKPSGAPDPKRLS